MGVNNFRAEDLSSANLESLVSELRMKVNNDEYSNIQKFARDFATKIQGMTIGVTPDGRRTVDVSAVTTNERGDTVPTVESVDLNNAVTKILQVIDEAKSHTLTTTQKSERDAMYVAVDEQLSGIFKQKQMMEELASREFDLGKFTDEQLKADKMSDERISRYKSELKKVSANKKKVLGEDNGLEGSLATKSLQTKLQDEIDGKSNLQNIEKSFASIKALEEAIKIMEDEITADPTLESRNRGNIDANKAEILQLSKNIEGAVDKVKRLNLPGFDVKSIEKCQDKSVMSRDDAEKAVRKLLYGDESYTDFKHDEGMEKRIAVAYENIKNSIDKNDKASFKPIMNKYNSTDESERNEARKAIEDYMKEIDKDIKDIGNKIKQETVLKTLRKETVVEYKKTLDRSQELSNRFNKVNVQAKSPDNEPLFIDADGNPTVTDTGRPLLVEDYVPSDSTKSEYLSDFDEASKKAEIEENGKERIEEMSWREKRKLLKEAGIGNFFTRLFPGRLARTEMSRLLPEATREELEDLETSKQEHINRKFAVEKAELDRTQQNVQTVEKLFERVKNSAAVQQRMQDGAHTVAQTRVEKPELIDAMESASYEELALVLSNYVLVDKDKKQRFDEEGKVLGVDYMPDDVMRKEYIDAMDARKNYTAREVVNRHATQRGVEVRENPNTPVHEDKSMER